MTSIEKLHFFDDPVALPNHIFCRMRFSGELNRDIVDQAANLLGQRHPLLRARVDRRQWVWTLSDTGPCHHWTTSGFSNHYCHLTLTEDSGVHGFFQVRNGQTDAVLQVHHAVCDGGGGMDVIRDFLLAYDNVFHGRAIDAGLPKLAPACLRRRNQIGFWTRRYWRHLYKQPIALFGASKFLFRGFFELESPSQPSDDLDQFPCSHGSWVEPEFSTQIQQRAIELNVSLNSMLFASLYLAIEDWRREVLGRTDNQWIRLLMPMNIRTRSHLRMPAANCSTIVQLDRRYDQMADANTFYHYLNREINMIRQWEFDKLFLLIVRTLTRLPGWLRNTPNSNQSRATAVFTNLGEPFRWARKRKMILDDGVSIAVGDTQLREFDFLGPVRRGTPFNLTVQRHCDQLRISVHRDPKVLALEDSDWILTRFIERSMAEISA